MAFSKANDIVLHYRQEGNPDGPAIVFSNSLGTDFRIWDAVVEPLRAHYSILRYDKRGHGLSEATPAPYSMETHVDDLRELLARTSVSKPLVVGLSIGGMIAQGLAIRYPDMVRAMVLMDTAHKIGTRQMWDQRIAAIERSGVAGVAEAILQRWFTPGFRDPENPDFAGYRNMLVRTSVDGYLGSCMALRDADYTAGVSGLSLPVLCIVGDQDGSTPPDLVRSTSKLIPGARFEIVADAGHLPCIEQPEATAKLIADFAGEVFDDRNG